MPDPITPILPDPQASVDAALGSIATPSPAATTPIVSEPPKVEIPPAPVVNAPMGDETPLAFAAPTLNAMPTTPPPTPEPTPAPNIVPEAPKLEPMPSVGSSYLPPVPPAPISTPPVEDKPKKKSKLMLVMIGIFAMLGVLGAGGYYVYNQQGGEKPIDVAAITEESKCTGCSRPQDGGWLVWRNGECKVTGICNSSNPNKDDSTPPENPSNPSEKPGCGSAGCCGTGYEYCGGAINKCVSFDALAAAGGGCNKYGEVVYNIPTTYGATGTLGSADQACSIQKCKCGEQYFCFDKQGYCNQETAPAGVLGSNYNTMGLCAVVGDYASDEIGAEFTPDPVIAGYSCTDSGCSTTNANCTTVRYTCSGTVGGNSCTNTSSAYIQGSQVTGTSGGFAGKCGTVEQLDVMCNGGYVTSRTRINPPCSSTASTPPNPSPSPSTPPVVPVLACTGLTNTPAAPVIGQTVTFTCAGTITPTGAATLSYKFKYSLNDGADQLLANKTNTTAELAITACGTYSVQCKVCATIAGVLKCDPTWTGAIQ